MKKGLYFKNQKPSPCGCYFPDAIGLGCDGKGKWILFCTRHGFSLHKQRRNKFNPEHTPMFLNKLPTEAWREKERKRMMKIK